MREDKAPSLNCLSYHFTVHPIYVTSILLMSTNFVNIGTEARIFERSRSMSISGKEETGNFSWQSSNYSAGIPIKKRKFPLFRPPSPESEELPYLSSAWAKSSSPSLELSSLKVNTGACSLGASNASKSPISDIKVAITADTHVKLAGLNCNSLLNPLDSLDTKDKLFLSGQQNITNGSKLDSAQVEVYAEPTRKNLSGSLQAGRDCTPELFRMPGNIRT